MDTKHDEKKRRDDPSATMLLLSPVATPGRLGLFIAIIFGNSSLGTRAPERQEQLSLSIAIPIAAATVGAAATVAAVVAAAFEGFIAIATIRI